MIKFYGLVGHNAGTNYVNFFDLDKVYSCQNVKILFFQMTIQNCHIE